MTTKDSSSPSLVGGSLAIMSKGVGLFTKPLTKLKDGLMSSMKEEDDATPSTEDSTEPMTLEGTLYYKKGGRGHKKPFTWKRRYIVLNMADGGSVSCYKIKDKDKQNMLRQMYTTLNRDKSEEKQRTTPAREEDVRLYLPPEIPWIVKDACLDARMFCIEIPVTDEAIFQYDDDEEEEDDVSDISSLAVESQVGESLLRPAGGNPMEQHPGTAALADRGMQVELPEGAVQAEHSLTPLPEESSIMGESARESMLAEELYDNIVEARQQSKKRLRFYFRCVRSGNEKALWLRAFAKIERMSPDASKKNRVMGTLSKVVAGNTRVRSETNAKIARDTRQLDRLFGSSPLHEPDEMNLSPSPTGKEFRVVPTYAYPHRWMTSAELREEMLLPSTHFHDLRLPSKRGQEIGTLKVEVLQCLGLPKLDRVSETDAVTYLICGSYAFCTDVINDCASPMWLRKTRRACIFPIFHGYARLYVGVFDDDGVRAKDDLAGRVVVDLAALRPGSQYDVTLPLRMSSHVYSRRKRGSVRLRFTLDWNSERAALLSYLPRTIPTPKTLKPYDDVTVMCTDEKAFRNVAITVHGAHLPGRFSPKHFKAMLREMNFTRKMVIVTLRITIKDTIVWRNPTMSLYVFCAWMHCIYANQFSLAPAYFIIYLLLHMMRNYAKYGMDGPTKLGFVPVSWEEMLHALLAGGNSDAQCFQPLEMQAVDPFSSARSDMDVFASDGTTDYAVKTHKPWGKPELRMVGFLESEEALKATNVDDEHQEFPFANGTDYPRFTVQEAYVERPSKTKSKRQTDGDPRSVLTSASSKLWHGVSRSGTEVGALNSMELTEGTLFEEEEVDRTIPRNGSGEMMEEVFDTLESEIGRSFSQDESEGDNQVFSVTSDSSSPMMRFPQQDIDRAGVKNDKTIVEDLAEAKMKMHDLTLQLFNDSAYSIKDRDALYYGYSQRTSKRKTTEDASKQLDKLLGLGEYSSGNMVVTRVAPYVEPIIGCVNAFLCLARALFNIFTWRDPFLSFWVSLLGALLAFILFIFPWRIFLFVVGIILVGPQNLVLRMLKERRDRRESARQSSDSSSTDGAATADTQPTSDIEDESLAPILPESQPVFKGHGEPNQKQVELNRTEVNPREVHHVVIPYSQLKYQRMYDWPPEPQYARVKIAPKVAMEAPAAPKISPTAQKRKSLYAASLRASSSLHHNAEQDPLLASVRRRSRTYSGNSSPGSLRRSPTKNTSPTKKGV